MLILRLCISSSISFSVRPALIIPRVPKQSDADHNIALQCQNFWISMNLSIKRVLPHRVMILYYPSIIRLQRDRPYSISSMLYGRFPLRWFISLYIFPYTSMVRFHPASAAPAQGCCYPARQAALESLERDSSGRSHRNFPTPCPSDSRKCLRR